jgi:hypothetical protein
VTIIEASLRKADAYFRWINSESYCALWTRIYHDSVNETLKACRSIDLQTAHPRHHHELYQKIDHPQIKLRLVTASEEVSVLRWCCRGRGTDADSKGTPMGLTQSHGLWNHRL